MDVPMTPNPAYVAAVQDSVHGAPYPHLIGMTIAALAFDSCRIELVNVDLKLNYLKAVAGGKLRADGRCLRAGRQISYAEASVFDEAGELIAHGTSTLMALPGKGLKIDVAKFLPQA